MLNDKQILFRNFSQITMSNRLITQSRSSLCDIFKKGLSLDAKHIVEISGLISPKEIYKGDGDTGRLIFSKYKIFNKTVDPFDDDKKFGSYCKFFVVIELDSGACETYSRIIIEDKNGQKMKKYPNYFGNIGDDSVLFEWYGKKHKNDDKTYFNFVDNNENETIMKDDEMHYKCQLTRVALFLNE